MEGQKQPGPRALVGLEFEDRLAIEQHVAGRDGIVGVARDRLGERGFAGAIGPHDGMDLATADGERDAFDDFLVTDGDVEIFDFELRTWRKSN